MKKCRQCSKVAALHITEIRNGEVQTLHLCESCAQEYLGSAQAESPEQPTDGLVEKLQMLAGDEELDEVDQLECPNCGITFKEFRSHGRLGCSHDYVVFADELVPLLDNIHNATQHCGKYPQRAPGTSTQHCQLIRLRNDLRVAVEQEDYEHAASLRDEIQALEADFEKNVSGRDAS